MKLYRYEFNNEGIFNALDYLYSVDMEQQDVEDFKEAEIYFEENLPAITQINLSKPFKFYFTEEGNEKFKDYIYIIMNLFDKYCSEFGSINAIIIDAPNDRHTIYHDTYQMVIETKHY